MIELEILGINDIDVGEISQLILDVKTSTGEWSEDVDLKRVEQVFLRNFEDTEDSILLARQTEKLIGFIVIHFDEQDTIEMNPWFLGGHPVVYQELGEIQLDSRMIQRVKEFAESINAVRVNVHFMKEEPPRKRMYEELGMTLFEKVTHLRASASELEIISAAPSNEVDIVPLHETPIESLYDCWYASFQSGQDRSFFTRTQEQNRAHFEEMFDREDYDTRASVALKKSKHVVGFALVKQTHGENNAHIWELGVHPDFKRRGYAKLMLAVVRDRLLQEGMKTVSLNYDTSNEPAMKLYRSYNFKERWTQIGYTWIL
ncbi:MAG: GNAT family N-acetyltransferase [Candidatus Thorarchaeota archaeon]|jgi:ribosomal protein S18 acetylase RimI-like enzyme